MLQCGRRTPDATCHVPTRPSDRDLARGVTCHPTRLLVPDRPRFADPWGRGFPAQRQAASRQVAISRPVAFDVQRRPDRRVSAGKAVGPLTWSNYGSASATKCRGLSSLRLPLVAVLHPCSRLRSRVQAIERGLLRIETDVRIVLEHPYSKAERCPSGRRSTLGKRSLRGTLRDTQKPQRARPQRISCLEISLGVTP